ncbi:hypothetical protein ACQ0P8_16325 (plasmid) [Halodesulfovibrio aestuarii]|uniref:Virion morphogenesis protein n=1 Tax=Halodesulfovibrio aestuarii TaxID=126333 RepID=A0A8G2CC48_9BACT|nr:hypothetical protein [Halodesulfovibrio aestuarii]SHJ72024.1 hypothetical protein SAMN05660830_03074 [Halodesulfovibrio aestuarii]
MSQNKPALNLSVDKRSRLRLREQLTLLQMPPKKQRRIVMSMARTVRKQAAQNIRQQRTVRGTQMAPRKNSRNKNRLLKKLAGTKLGKNPKGKGKGLNVYGRGKTKAEVTWGNAFAARIAYAQQHGIAQKWSASKARKRYGVPNYKAPATRAQAKALLDAGYRLRVRKKRGKGTRLKRVTIKWIRENMTVGKAALILNILRGNENRPTAWEVKPEARPFLGVPAEKADEMLQDLARQTLQQLKKA